MPAAARGRFFFSMSLQTSRIVVIMLFVALTSLIYVSSSPINGKVLCRLPALSYGLLLLTWSSLHANAEGAAATDPPSWLPRRSIWSPVKPRKFVSCLVVASQVLDWSTVC